jgi:hypothetical protein
MPQHCVSSNCWVCKLIFICVWVGVDSRTSSLYFNETIIHWFLIQPYIRVVFIYLFSWNSRRAAGRPTRRVKAGYFLWLLTYYCCCPFFSTSSLHYSVSTNYFFFEGLLNILFSFSFDNHDIMLHEYHFYFPKLISVYIICNLSMHFHFSTCCISAYHPIRYYICEETSSSRVTVHSISKYMTRRSKITS